MAFSFGTPNNQNSTFTAATKPTFSFGVGATTTSTSGFGGFGTPATTTGFGSFGAPATTTAALFKALGASPASAAPFSFAAKPITGLGNTSFRKEESKLCYEYGTRRERNLRFRRLRICIGPELDSTAPTFGSTAPTFVSAAPTSDSAAPTFDTNTLGGTNTSGTPFGASGSFGQSFETKPSTELNGFGKTLGSAPQFGQVKCDIRCQSEQEIERAADELAELRLNACRPTLLQVVAQQEVVGHVQAALSPEEKAAWARVKELTSQTSLDNDPDLGNHPSVEVSRNVRGVEKNIYFFNHDYIEQNQNDNITRSNHKEAHMTLGLANYLIKQGYTAEDITILAYSGQMFYMTMGYTDADWAGDKQDRKSVSGSAIYYCGNLVSWASKKQSTVALSTAEAEYVAAALTERLKYASLSDVKITVADSYQGEESKIILLSLVRNNEENIIGCLGADNKVCVALLRAKEGLYIFGNINMMKTGKSGLWTKIATTLENNGCLGTTLNLKCQYHPDQITTISTPEDFDKLPPVGGCFKMCNYQYDCGHKCQLLCHGYDREHINTKCTMKCESVLCELGHICPLLCGVDCEPCEVDVKETLPCGHEMNKFCHLYLKDPQNKCLTKVDFTLPDCEHKAQKYCYQNINEVKCSTRCTYQFECGHVCGRNCHVTDDDPNHEKKKCGHPCEYRLECGHECGRYCHLTDDPNNVKHICVKPCGNRLECGHVCGRFCHVTDDPNHEKYICEKPCEYRLECGHVCDFDCHVNDDPNHEKHKCIKRCEYRFECDHVCGRICHVTDDPNHKKKKCRQPCEYRLECGHECGINCHVIDYTNHSFCVKTCEYRFQCGHVCGRNCHVTDDDPNHEKSYCVNTCEYRFQCGHVCGRNCHVTDDDPNHEKLKCVKPCQYRLECGHACDFDCHVTDDPNHEKQTCRQFCEYQLDCGHVCEFYCHVTDDPNHEEYKCSKPCARAKAGCLADLVGDRGDHQCRKLCWHKCFDCKVQVEKLIPECLHTIKLQCKQIPTHELCYKKCERLMSCGHPCMDKCGAACDPTKCTKPSLTEVWSPCGHKVRPPCNLSALYAKGEVQWEQFPQYCNTPCGATLACKHLCAGSCFGCVQGRLHQPCTQQCNQDNICGHQCQEPCNQICPPCKMPCEVKCVHSRCKKLCGEPCTPCQEPCSRACVHGACSRRCGEPCDRAPCSEQCARLRPCGHRCRGLCGEPCPDICQRCRPVEFPKDFLGDPYEETAKFIVLQDCDHILEVDSMDCLMMGDQENIQIRKCPFCRKVIINTNRYKDTVNKMFKDDINPIKLRVYGTQKEIQVKLTELNSKVDRFTEEYRIYLRGYLKPTFSIFTSLLKTQKNVSLLEVEMECVYLNIFEMIAECWKTYRTQTPKVTLLKDELKDHIKVLLRVLKINPESRIPIKISEQQQNDVGNEIKRLNVIVQLSTLLHLAISTTDEHVTQQVETTKAVVLSLTVFNEDWALESLKQLQKMIKISAPVTKYERELVVKAIGLKAGHWYKCPNGHFYCIGECGGAMALGRCPEAGCGAAIGGAQHTLTAGNSHAPEMDGSRFAAWSEQGNNMANIVHDDII